jgi:uncharacterized protein (DUF488 family)
VTIYTIGHSTRTIEEFLAMLKAHGIETLVDVRTAPGSRRNPQFGQESLRGSLHCAGIEYRHMRSLGGLRRPRGDSANTGWRNDSFRGYADYMQTAEFGQAIDDLMAIAAASRTAIMCAEAVPWRCHRSLIGDALLVRGLEVLDILGSSSTRAHTLTSFARLEGLRITYPPAQPELPI